MKTPAFSCKKVINCYLKLLFNFCFDKCVCGLSHKKQQGPDKECLHVLNHDYTIWRMLVLILYYLVSYEKVDETQLFVSSSSALQINCFNL
jgi:hypothetical protein